MASSMAARGEVQGQVNTQMQAVADARSQVRGEVQSQASVVGDVRGQVEPVELPRPEFQAVSTSQFSSNVSAPPVNASAAGQAAAQSQIRNGAITFEGQGSGQASGNIGL